MDMVNMSWGPGMTLHWGNQKQYLTEQQQTGN